LSSQNLNQIEVSGINRNFYRPENENSGRRSPVGDFNQSYDRRSPVRHFNQPEVARQIINQRETTPQTYQREPTPQATYQNLPQRATTPVQSTYQNFPQREATPLQFPSINVSNHESLPRNFPTQNIIPPTPPPNQIMKGQFSSQKSLDRYSTSTLLRKYQPKSQSVAPSLQGSAADVRIPFKMTKTVSFDYGKPTHQPQNENPNFDQYHRMSPMVFPIRDKLRRMQDSR
jgi:hypothetical protein